MTLTKEKLEQRRNGIGGSDAAAVCGLSRYKTPYGIYLEKLGLSFEGNNSEVNCYLEWGQILEDVIARYFSEKNNVELTKRGTKWHKKHKFMFANIDRFIESRNAILEIKTTDKFLSKRWGEEGGDQVPLEYLLQCCHYAAVYDVETVYIVVLIGGNDFRQYLYQRDKELEDRLIQKEKEFWEMHVLRRKPPKAVTSQDILNKYPASTSGTQVIANKDIEEKLGLFRHLQSQIKSETDNLNKLKVEIQDFMGESELIVNETGEILASWKSSKERSTFSLQEFKEKHGDLYEAFLVKKRGNRTFLIKK